MINFSKAIFTLLLGAVAITGCQKADITIDPPAGVSNVTLEAAMGADTKMDFTDDGGNGVKVKWSKDDIFTVYLKNSDNTGSRVGNFILTGGDGTKVGIFKAMGGVTLNEGQTYIAVYPATGEATYNEIKRITAGQTEQADKIDQLDRMCFMESGFTFAAGDDAAISTKLSFNHTHAIMTMIINAPASYNAATDGVPVQVSMFNSRDNSYSNVQLVAANWDTPIKAHTMITKSSGIRDLVFTVTTSTGKIFTQTLTSSNEHKTGMRYTATLGNLTPSGEEVTLASFDTATPSGDRWIITDADATAVDKAAFAGLRAVLKSLSQGGRKIEIIMPNIVTIPDDAFDAFNGMSSEAFVSISLPKATVIGNYAFFERASLTSINLPMVETIGEYALYDCASLTSINLPMVETIEVNGFSGCKSLTSVNLPKATTIGPGTFGSCNSLTSISLPMAKTIGESAFYDCASLTSINLPMVETIGYAAFQYCRSLTALTIATKSTITQFGDADGNVFNHVVLANVTVTTNAGNNGTTKNADNTWTVPSSTGTTVSYGPFKEIIVSAN